MRIIVFQKIIIISSKISNKIEGTKQKEFYFREGIQQIECKPDASGRAKEREMNSDGFVKSY
ncbi:MAG: hypothetical protein BGN96_01500 [Bacteroidales bacterium 45-6]|nr:MAG: hypothetical protein BGN96_01500 [Bacteroidales bacterium 45-6]